MQPLAAGLATLVSLAALAVVSDTAAEATPPIERARIARVIDGDTIVLTNGARVRLLQIDTPEPGTAECYSRAAGRQLRRLLPEGAVVTLEPDPPLDLVDRYGRLLRYVRRGGLDVNLELVRRGAATVWFYGRRARPPRRASSRRRIGCAQPSQGPLGRLPRRRVGSLRPGDDRAVGMGAGRLGRPAPGREERERMRCGLPDGVHPVAAA